MNIQKTYIVIFSLFISIFSYSQTTIKGTVKDDNNLSLTSANGNTASCWFCDCNELAKTLAKA